MIRAEVRGAGACSCAAIAGLEPGVAHGVGVGVAAGLAALIAPAAATAGIAPPPAHGVVRRGGYGVAGSSARGSMIAGELLPSHGTLGIDGRASRRSMRSAAWLAATGSRANGASAAATSATDGNRASGDFSRQRCTTAVRPGGSGTVNAAGGSTATFTHISLKLSASNGRVPSISSNSTAPSDHTSVRASTVRAERICSGDMYAGVPSIDWVWVSDTSVLFATFEMPKSSSFTSGVPSPRQVTKKFDGLTSRWTMPRAWASARPSHAWTMNSTASAGAMRWLCSSMLSRSTPSRYSITR